MGAAAFSEGCPAEADPGAAPRLKVVTSDAATPHEWPDADKPSFLERGMDSEHQAVRAGAFLLQIFPVAAELAREFTPRAAVKLIKEEIVPAAVEQFQEIRNNGLKLEENDGI